MNSGKSAPLPRLSPTPRMTTTLTSLSTDAARTTSAYRSRASDVGAFRKSGRSNVIVAILVFGSFSYRMISSAPGSAGRFVFDMPALSVGSDGGAAAEGRTRRQDLRLVVGDQYGVAAEHRADAGFPHVRRDGEHRAGSEPLVRGG